MRVEFVPMSMTATRTRARYELRVVVSILFSMPSMPSMPSLPPVKPRLRGVLHQWAFFVSLVTGAALVIVAPAGRATLATAIYAITVAGLFGVSATYHRVDWASPAARRWMRRLDHSMIFLLIAGTYTPFALLVLDGPLATAILVAVWGGALAGIVLNLVWIDAPKWVTAIVYVGLGWVAVVAFPQLFDELGVTATMLVAVGGILYTLGAVVYASRKPDPAPAVFGYHEIFHALVIAAAAVQYSVVAFYVV
jgi:hemolysin III